MVGGSFIISQILYNLAVVRSLRGIWAVYDMIFRIVIYSVSECAEHYTIVPWQNNNL